MGTIVGFAVGLKLLGAADGTNVVGLIVGLVDGLGADEGRKVGFDEKVGAALGILLLQRLEFKSGCWHCLKMGSLLQYAPGSQQIVLLSQAVA